MHRLMIVDDEPMIREGLKSIIDWNKVGFTWVGEASTGPEALIKHGQLAPNLILIDIRMPGMDGLQVIEEIRKVDAECHFLILSGYSDFTYAKQAIEFGVDGYLLKPIDDDELFEYAKRVSSLIAKQSEQAINQEQTAVLHRDELLKSVMTAGADEAAINELSQLLGITSKSYQLLLIEWSRTEERDAAVILAAKRKMAQLIEAKGAGWLFNMEPYTALLLKDLVTDNGSREQIKQWIEQAAGLELKFIAVAGEAVRMVADLPHSYETALDSIKYSFMLPACDVHLGSKRLADTDRQEEESNTSTSLDELGKKLFYMLDIGSKEGVQQTLKDAGALICLKHRSEQRIKMSFAQMLTIVINKLSVVHVQLSIEDEMRMITDLYKQTNYDEMLHNLNERLSQLAFRLGNSSNMTVIKQITDFIERHHSENLKLETLAELFNYNSGYLGKMFKNFTGEHFNTYLDKVRIQHAIELLQQGLKVHQVSELVGYANVDYFHSKFKKYKGLSPSSFKRIVKEGAENPPVK